MQILNVVLPDAAYQVYIGTTVLQDGLCKNLGTATKAMLVTDTNVAALHLPTVCNELKNINFDVLVLEDGESQKNWHAVDKILTALVQKNHDRYSVIISLGGGVVGDLTGLAAALYMRGITWIQIPTTLLAQVDASVGGKTGCNFAGNKNIIGVFKQPHCVLIDPTFLHTLSPREFENGLAEVIKSAFACDEEFFEWLETNAAALKMREPQVVATAIMRSCKIKINVVQIDPLDLGIRRHLNFGHTFGHAIEAATGFKEYLHGEAVAIGMVLATRLAVRLGMISMALEARLCNMLNYFGLPTRLGKGLTVGMLHDYMLLDKKKRGSSLRLILPCAVGEVRVVVGDAQTISFIKEVDRIC